MRNIVFLIVALFCVPASATTVTLSPGSEGQIATNLTAGNNVTLVAGQTYTLSSTTWVAVFNASNVTLDGSGATVKLSTSFNNHAYAPFTIHGASVHTGVPSPLATALGFYFYNCSGVTIKNMKVERTAVDGTVVRSLALVKCANCRVTAVEFTGNTIGPIVDVIRCTDLKIDECNIHDSLAVNTSGTLDLTNAGKPNLTGIQQDDVDLLSATQRTDPTYHSFRTLLVGNQIKNLTMDASVPTGTPWKAQTDGINLQRGWSCKILNNIITNTDEGVDIFSSQGLIKGNVVKLSPYVANTGAGIKMAHGASRNLVTTNTIINRDVGTICDISPQPNLTTTGVTGNVITLNTLTGSGSKLWRISTGGPSLNPTANIMVRNAGGTNSSDYPSGSEPNFFYASNAEPMVKVADFSGDHEDDVMFLYTDGHTKIYNTFDAAGSWEMTSNYGLINNMSTPDDVNVFDWNGDGLPDVFFQLGSDTRRTFLNQGNGQPFSYRGTIAY